MAAVLTVGGDARADDAAAAEEIFRRGKAHMDAGRFAKASADFELSESLDSSVGTLLNLGECQVKTGKTASAWAAFSKASVKAEREGQVRRRDYAKRRASELEPTLTRLKVTIAGKSPPGLTVTRSGEDISLLIGTKVPVDPAEYVFEATAPGHKSWSQTMKVAGAGKAVALEIPALEVIPLAAAPDTSDGTDTSTTQGTTYESGPVDSDPGASRRLIGLGVGGAGVVAVVTGLVFGSLARSDLSKSEDHCDSDNLCDQTGVDLVADAKSSANISTALVTVGGAALLAGGILWFTAPKKSDSKLQAMPTAGPGHVGFALTGGF
jgi:hypothetical protein